MIQKEGLNHLLIQFEKPSLILEGESKTMDMANMGKFVSYLYQTLEKSQIDYTIEVSFPLCLMEETVLKEMLEKKRISTCCHVQKENGIVFDVNGEVIPCNHFLGYPFQEGPLDLKNDKAIEELWKTQISKEFREIVHRYPAKKCSQCNLWKICGGGCFTRWFYLDPKKYIF